MNARAQKLLDEALGLPPADRARLAAELEASLEDASPEEVEEAWTKEIASRVRDVRKGRVKLVPAAKVLRDARKRLRSAR